MTVERKITVFGVRPEHPNRDEDSIITLVLSLDYLKGHPIERIQISPYVARKLAEEAIIAARIVDDSNTERARRKARRA